MYCPATILCICSSSHPPIYFFCIDWFDYIVPDYGVLTCAGYPGSIKYMQQDSKVLKHSYPIIDTMKKLFLISFPPFFFVSISLLTPFLLSLILLFHPFLVLPSIIFSLPSFFPIFHPFILTFFFHLRPTSSFLSPFFLFPFLAYAFFNPFSCLSLLISSSPTFLFSLIPSFMFESACFII